MIRSALISFSLLLGLAGGAAAESFCRDWPVFGISDGTRACAAVFGPMTGQGFTGATGKFHILSEYVPNDRANDARGRALCSVYKDQILAQSRAMGLQTPDYIVIMQTWKIGEQSPSVDKVFNWTLVADKECRKVRF